VPVVAILIAALLMLILTAPSCGDEIEGELIRDVDVLVIGGGLSGLYFADQLLMKQKTSTSIVVAVVTTTSLDLAF
jgi:hypothetical protein